MSDDDRSLADTAEEPVDVTPEVDVDDFDFEAFLSGVRATRRAVKVYARADLVAQMDEVAGGYRDDMPAQAKRKILTEVTRLREEFEASGRWFVAEARSQEWIDDFRAKEAKRLGLDPAEAAGEADLTQDQRDARTALTMAQIAEQIVTPSGVTAEGLARLGRVAPSELGKVTAAVVVANTKSAQSGVTRDFSQGRSAKKPPQRDTSSRN